MTSQRSPVQIQYRPPHDRCKYPHRETQNIATTDKIRRQDAQDLPTDSEIRALISETLAGDLDITPMAGFKLDLSANAGFKKAFFSVRCECGTAAVLSVEVSDQKTMAEVAAAMPALVDRLESQARSFRAMSCDIHTRMRLGGAAQRPS